MGRKVDVVKAYNKLPYEAKQQIDTVLSDDGLSLKDVDIKYLIKDVKWTIERMDMDMGDMSGEEYYDALNTKKECLKWLNQYGKYE